MMMVQENIGHPGTSGQKTLAVLDEDCAYEPKDRSAQVPAAVCGKQEPRLHRHKHRLRNNPLMGPRLRRNGCFLAPLLLEELVGGLRVMGRRLNGRSNAWVEVERVNGECVGANR